MAWLRKYRSNEETVARYLLLIINDLDSVGGVKQKYNVTDITIFFLIKKFLNSFLENTIIKPTVYLNTIYSEFFLSHSISIFINYLINIMKYQVYKNVYYYYFYL